MSESEKQSREQPEFYSSPNDPDSTGPASDGNAHSSPQGLRNDGLWEIDVGEFDDEPEETNEAQIDPVSGDSSHPPDLILHPSQADDDRYVQLQTERDELQEKVLRVTADYQNLARRSRISIDEARQQQIMNVARALLTPLDQFDHALNVDVETTDAKAILQGVQIVRDELMKAIEQFGVRRLEAQVGEPFDPNRHEGLMRQPVEGLDPDHVAAQLQPGYTLEDKVLRPVKVAISE